MTKGFSMPPTRWRRDDSIPTLHDEDMKHLNVIDDVDKPDIRDIVKGAFYHSRCCSAIMATLIVYDVLRLHAILLTCLIYNNDYPTIYQVI